MYLSKELLIKIICAVIMLIHIIFYIIILYKLNKLNGAKTLKLKDIKDKILNLVKCLFTPNTSILGSLIKYIEQQTESEAEEEKIDQGEERKNNG